MPSYSEGRNHRIYLYEDDQVLAEEIIIAFAAEGTTVELILDESGLRARMRQGAPVMILDRIVANRDSLDVVQEMRAQGNRTPIMLISSLSSVDDRIVGLKAGGDDYLVKPFAMGELIARVAALCRRAAPENRRTSLQMGTLVVDLIARSATRSGREVNLLPREFALLEYLMRHAGQVITRTMLLEEVWHFRASTQTNVVDVHIGNLRRKIETNGEEKMIVSVRGVGFKFVAEGAEP